MDAPQKLKPSTNALVALTLIVGALFNGVLMMGNFMVYKDLRAYRNELASYGQTTKQEALVYRDQLITWYAAPGQVTNQQPASTLEIGCDGLGCLTTTSSCMPQIIP